MDEAALVLFSGGQDVSACLAWALDRHSRVETVGFAYGQRHAVELDCREPIRRRDGPALGRPARAGLGRRSRPVARRARRDRADADVEISIGREGLPTTFVPGRNLLFLTYSAALAYRRGVRRIVGGMCETDFSGYPGLP